VTQQCTTMQASSGTHRIRWALFCESDGVSASNVTTRARRHAFPLRHRLRHTFAAPRPASRTLGEPYTPRHNHTNHTTAVTRRQRRARMSRAVDLSEIFFGRFAGRNRVSATTLTMIKNIGKHETAAASQCVYTLCVHTVCGCTSVQCTHTHTQLVGSQS